MRLLPADLVGEPDFLEAGIGRLLAAGYADYID